MRIKIYFAVAGVIFLCSFSHAADDAAFKKGAAAYIAGNSDEAMILLYKAYTANPDDKKTKSLLAEVYIDQAAKAIASGDYVTASKYINKAGGLKMMDGKITELKESLKSLTAEESPPKIQKPAEKKALPPKIKDSEKKTVQKSEIVGNARQKGTKEPQSVSPIIIKERIIERPAPGMDWKKSAVIGVIFVMPVIIAALIFFKLYLNERSKEKSILEEQLLSENRLKKEMDNLRHAAEKLKAEISEEKKKKKPEAITNYGPLLDARKEEADKEIKARVERMENSLSAIRNETGLAGAKPRREETAGFSGKQGSLPLKYFLPAYTEIPIDTFSLSEMLDRASGLSARTNLIWALGNKTDPEAVDTLESHLAKAKGEEYKEILKSLKKITLRPEISVTVKSKIENIFSAQRRKGIII
ncbi:hypothetical protein KJ633_07110 [bacterium]|nr:hypothetical protein [bacterium]MBU3956215.1 hypothetical protein [bacterium]